MHKLTIPAGTAVSFLGTAVCLQNELTVDSRETLEQIIERFEYARRDSTSLFSAYLGNGWWKFSIFHKTFDPTRGTEDRMSATEILVFARFSGHKLLNVSFHAPSDSELAVVAETDEKSPT